MHVCIFFIFFFFNDTATTEIYTLSLHDALPICRTGRWHRGATPDGLPGRVLRRAIRRRGGDRKSTRLNSSHVKISYAVFCLKKKKKNEQELNAAHTQLQYHHVDERSVALL